tara:strand:- start:19 stop:426 length:408 start_codon:yes stop_codon:yes gene_type:complete
MKNFFLLVCSLFFIGTAFSQEVVLDEIDSDQISIMVDNDVGQLEQVGVIDLAFGEVYLNTNDVAVNLDVVTIDGNDYYAIFTPTQTCEKLIITNTQKRPGWDVPISYIALGNNFETKSSYDYLLSSAGGLSGRKI